MKYMDKLNYKSICGNKTFMQFSYLEIECKNVFNVFLQIKLDICIEKSALLLITNTNK